MAVLALATCLVSGAASAEESKWAGSVVAYGWLLSMNGDAAVRGTPADIDVGFDTILENFDGGVMAAAEVSYGKFGVFVNGVYGRDTADETVSLGPIGIQTAVDIRMTFLDFGAYYRFDAVPLGNATAEGFQPSLIVEPYVGGRYTDVDLKLRVNRLKLDADIHFLDPIFGVRTSWQFADRWKLNLAGDIGGFGVGSDFSWNAIGTVGYQFGLFGERDGALVLGYRALGQDYTTGSSGSQTKWDVISHGPLIGLQVSF